VDAFSRVALLQPVLGRRSRAFFPHVRGSSIGAELRQCLDPEIPVNVAELGLDYAVRSEPVTDGGHRVEVLMTVTSPARSQFPSP
jgi:hypothetical protein